MAKRLRRPTTTTTTTLENVDVDVVDDDFKPSSSSSPPVMVTGLPFDCPVLELKSRLEMYGPISRTCIDADDGTRYASAASASTSTSASLNPALGIAIRSNKVLVCRAADPLLVWKTGAVATAPSKLLCADIPHCKHGRSNKKLTAASASTKSASEPPHKGREIVAYDDLF